MTRRILFGLFLSLTVMFSVVDAQVEKQDPEKTVSANPMVMIVTNMGEMKVELFAQKAPVTVANFLKYTEDKYYDGTIFHRVIPKFMIQGGGFLPGMKKKKTREPIKNEATNGLKNLRGTLAMARTGIIDSATSQFFINHKDNAFLDHTTPTPRGYGYAVFGQVIKGLDVLDKIASVKTGHVGHYGDVPTKDVVILSVRKVKSKTDDSKSETQEKGEKETQAHNAHKDQSETDSEPGHDK